MVDVLIINLILFILIILQSIAGVGILVIGTPTFLILNYSLAEIMSLLLPISIITSALNIFFLKFYERNTFVKINNDYLLLFFGMCIPSVFLGLYLMNIFENKLNFEYMVVGVIFITFIISRSHKYGKNILKKANSIFLILVGIVHGLTNSGGSLLSLLISQQQNKLQSRFMISFFYFFLAFFQFILFLFIFRDKIILEKYFPIIIFIPLGVIFGNILAKHFNEVNYKFLVSSLAMITCIILLINT